MVADTAKKRLTALIKFILFLYWILGFQTIKYLNNEFCITGSKRVIYPAILISLYAYNAVSSIIYGVSGVSTPMYILYTADVSLEVVEILAFMFTFLLDSYYIVKKAQLYTNLHQAYSEIFESDHVKSMAIKRILLIYLVYAVCSVCHYIIYFDNSGIGLTNTVIITIRTITIDFAILQNVVEIWFCTVGFYSLNERLCNFSWANAYLSRFSEDVDFQTIGIYPKFYRIEWIEKTTKRDANLQTFLDVYNRLFRCVDLVTSRFRIMFIIQTLNTFLTWILIANALVYHMGIKQEQTIGETASKVLWIFHSSFDMLAGVFTAEVLQMEWRRTKTILAKLLICCSSDSENIKTLSRFVNLATKVSDGLAVYRIPIGLSFVSSVIAVTASYFFVIIQMITQKEQCTA